MLGTDLSHDRWEGLGNTTEPRLARKERWFQCVDAAARLRRVMGSPTELCDDDLARQLIVRGVCDQAPAVEFAGGIA